VLCLLKRGTLNFFRKKNNTFITLEEPDFSAETRKLWGDLMFALEGQDVSQVTIQLYDNGDLPLRVVSVLTALGLKLASSSVQCDLKVSSQTAQMLRRLNLTSAFANITEVQ